MTKCNVTNTHEVNEDKLYSDVTSASGAVSYGSKNQNHKCIEEFVKLPTKPFNTGWDHKMFHSGLVRLAPN